MTRVDSPEPTLRFDVTEGRLTGNWPLWKILLREIFVEGPAVVVVLGIAVEVLVFAVEVAGKIGVTGDIPDDLM